jgi:hypothetical protein
MNRQKAIAQNVTTQSKTLQESSMEKRQKVLAFFAAIMILLTATLWWLAHQEPRINPPVVITAAKSKPMTSIRPTGPVAVTVSAASAPLAPSNPATPAVTALKPAPATSLASPAPAKNASTAPDHQSDAIALSEEEIDQVEAENKDLASRASDLKSQVNDGNAIIAMKAKQIKELEAQLGQTSTATAATAANTTKRPQKPSSTP